MDEQARLAELDAENAEPLVETALETEYVDRLERYLDAEHDEAVPIENPRAFERGDGVRAVSFESETTVADRPALAVTVHVDDGAVVQATAERRGPDVDGTVELLFPAEIAPDPAEAVRDLFEARGQSVSVTVDESGDVTAYAIEA
ncbi:hypothetical protein HTZ84_16135 [Haloterrigena sp. SYSU A558-1]|uniref:Halobacterial output domain-containing protein n=1 Tax=Haloterrigena gelatinilytica TaxID=2741724 RepID=A0ABX2LDL7_9EURY|nr:hypothetical protein [Haloterrigena gelatinilytica]NUC73811.1 hypothetical protein [Haloterrigena gelatinilytica]